MNAVVVREVLDIGPLHSTIDPDVLDALVSKHGSDDEVRTTFDYHGHEVTVRNNGCLPATKRRRRTGNSPE